MKIVIVGGGVSGIITAIKAKNKFNEVIILERNDKPLKKLLMTGAGRCNYYNDNTDLSNYHSDTENLIGRIISYNNLNLLNDFYDELGLIPKVINGYYYPSSKQASTMYDALMFEVKKLGIKIEYNYLVETIEKKNNKFIINNDIVSDFLVLSTGSYSYPSTGSDGMGYDFLKKFNHNIIKPLPALTPVISNHKYLKDLSGIRTDVELKLIIDNELISKETGELQLTDYGLSGICTFNLSHIITRKISESNEIRLDVNFIPFITNPSDWIFKYAKRHEKKNLKELLDTFLNKKLTNVILKTSNIDGYEYFLKLDDNKKQLIINNLINHKFIITDVKGYNKSQVTSGGLSLKEINTNTCESIKVKNLYITGELLDITGNCGGYNLMECFITSILAGSDINVKSKTN